MRNVSTAFKQLLYNNRRNYDVTLEITLSDSTEFTIENDHIMSDGIDLEDAVGEDDNFTALGSTIINGCTVTLYNNDEIYSDYVFDNAEVIVKINLTDANASDEIQFGVFTVDEASYGESTITLSLLDNMCQFDRAYEASSYAMYTTGTTVGNIVADACTKCGVLPDLSMATFPNRNFVVSNAPKDNCTYREVIGWCATLAGCFAKMTSDGKLKFDWFNVSAFETITDGGIFDDDSPYSTGDTVEGGAFNPWNNTSTVDGGSFTDANGVHYITALRSQNIGVDDVVITGIRVTYDVDGDDSNSTETQLRGTDDYVIEIENNPFINADNYASILDFLQPILIGLQFRTCNITHVNDPTIEAGDIGYIFDTKGIQHKILITRVTFNPTSLQTVVCGAESVGKNSSTRLSEITKAIAKSRRMLNDEKNIRAQLRTEFDTAVANNKGLYWTKVEEQGGAVTIYAHDKPVLANSSTVLKINSGAIATTGNYTGNDATTTWYGFEFNGTWLANIISTIGINFDWGVGGQLIIEDENHNETLYVDADTGVVRINATQFSLAGSTISSIAEGEAQDELAKYLSSDNTGIMVADMTDGTTHTPSTAPTGVKNTFIDDDSFDVRDGQDVLASFGEETLIGPEGAGRMKLGASGAQITDSFDNARFRIGTLNTSNSEWVDFGTRTVTPIHPTTYTETITGIIDSDYPIQVIFHPESTQEIIEFEYGESGTEISDEGHIITYDGHKKIDITAATALIYTVRWRVFSGIYALSLENRGTGATGNQSVSFGEGNDVSYDYSGAVGVGLVTSRDSQFVIGQCNEGNGSNLFEIGCGHPAIQAGYDSNGHSFTRLARDSNSAENAFAVTEDGDTLIKIDDTAATGTLDGDLYAAITTLGWENEVII